MAIHELFAYLCVRDTGAAIEFYRQAFGATELFRLDEPGGRVGHAEVDFGGATLMVCDEFPEHGIVAPDPTAGSSATIHLHVDDADIVLEQAVAAGATLVRPATDAFYGERSGVIVDPFGHRWNIGHSIEDVTPEEMQRRYDQTQPDGQCPPDEQ
ncbi:MAG: putative glyoxalase/bleomycin resistance protein [Acidimicrobiia bacterium]